MPAGAPTPKTLRSRGHRELRTILIDMREQANLTQRQLAPRLGKPQSYVWKIENGERGIDPVECAAWARACGVDPRVFFNRFADALDRRI